MLKTPLSRLRLVGLLEAVFFLLLLGIAMPLKYIAGMPEMVQVVGRIHGILFILFTAAVAQASAVYQWPLRLVVAVMVAALIPFGPFVLDRRLRSAPVADPGSGGGAVAGMGRV